MVSKRWRQGHSIHVHHDTHWGWHCVKCDRVIFTEEYDYKAVYPKRRVCLHKSDRFCLTQTKSA